MDPRNISESRGYQQITGLSAVARLTVPDGANCAVVSAESQQVRYRDDNGTPTASVGKQIPVGAEIIFEGDSLAKLQFIEETASAKLNVSYYFIRVRDPQ